MEATKPWVLTSQFDGVDIADFRVAPEILSEAWEALDRV